jgi:hypothetical protein
VPLPQNPRVAGGVRLLYLGEGRRDLVGPRTSARYVVSERRRLFTADATDVAGLLHRPYVILAP